MNRPSKLLAVIVATLFACGHAQASEPETQTAVRVPGTRVSLAAPNGFEPSKQFPGFQQADAGSSVMIMEIPGPFSEVRAGVTKEGAASHGMTLLTSEQVRIAGRDGVLVLVSQEVSGLRVRKWLGVFGDDRASVMVIGIFPEAVATKMSEPLKRAVLSAQWDTGRNVEWFEGLTFRIHEPATLKIANRMSNMLLLTKGGTQPPIPPAEPMLIVGSATSEVDIADIEKYAKSRITQTATVTDVKDIKGKSVTVGGAPAYEIVAAATHSNSKIELVLYQVIVVRGKSGFIAQGLVGTSAADRYLPEFREVTSGLSFVD